jgi:hypothetical protein
MHYDWEFSRRVRCRKTEKSRCLALVAEILALAKKARAYGLLSLLDEAESGSHPLLRKGLQLIVDGEKPSTVAEILKISILAGDARGRELLEQCIVLEGLTGIQNGLNPRTIKEYLLAFLGEENAALYAAHYEESPLEEMEAFLSSIESSRPSALPATALDRTLEDLSDDAIEQCLKEITTLDLAKAFQGLSAKIQERIFKILPQRGAATLKNILEEAGTVDPGEVAEAHARIETALADLHARGAIRPEAS